MKTVADLRWKHYENNYATHWWVLEDGGQDTGIHIYFGANDTSADFAVTKDDEVGDAETLKVFKKLYTAQRFGMDLVV